jgi:hypothetical protein
VFFGITNTFLSGTNFGILEGKTEILVLFFDQKQDAMERTSVKKLFSTRLKALSVPKAAQRMLMLI